MRVSALERATLDTRCRSPRNNSPPGSRCSLARPASWICLPHTSCNKGVWCYCPARVHFTGNANTRCHPSIDRQDRHTNQSSKTGRCHNRNNPMWLHQLSTLRSSSHDVLFHLKLRYLGRRGHWKEGNCIEHPMDQWYKSVYRFVISHCTMPPSTR